MFVTTMKESPKNYGYSYYRAKVRRENRKNKFKNFLTILGIFLVQFICGLVLVLGIKFTLDLVADSIIESTRNNIENCSRTEK
jgi:amino acid permease